MIRKLFLAMLFVAAIASFTYAIDTSGWTWNPVDQSWTSPEMFFYGEGVTPQEAEAAAWASVDSYYMAHVNSPNQMHDAQIIPVSGGMVTPTEWEQVVKFRVFGLTPPDPNPDGGSEL